MPKYEIIIETMPDETKNPETIAATLVMKKDGADFAGQSCSYNDEAEALSHLIGSMKPLTEKYAHFVSEPKPAPKPKPVPKAGKK